MKKFYNVKQVHNRRKSTTSAKRLYPDAADTRKRKLERKKERDREAHRSREPQIQNARQRGRASKASKKKQRRRGTQGEAGARNTGTRLER